MIFIDITNNILYYIILYYIILYYIILYYIIRLQKTLRWAAVSTAGHVTIKQKQLKPALCTEFYGTVPI